MRHLLLVEDNPADQRLFKMAVDASGVDYEVVVAEDGERVLAYLMAGGQSDLMVLDWRLVRIDGAEILRRLRSSPLNASMAVVVFSSSESPRELERAQALGARWFRKPIDLTEYFEVVKEMLSSAVTGAANA